MYDRNLIKDSLGNLLKRLPSEPQFPNQGNVVFIDLKSKKMDKCFLSMDTVRNFLGGRGGNMYLLANLLNPLLDPLDENIPLIFGSGLLTGILPSGTRGNLTGWSPESRIILDSNAGDDFYSFLKLSGIDHMVFYHRSDEPVLIVIGEGTVSFKPAREWSGLNNLEFRKSIAGLYNGRWGVDLAMLNITAAGENGALTSGVMAGIKAIHARGGGGAKMGSMNVKGILVILRNKKRHEWVNKPGVTEINRAVAKQVMNTSVFKVLSTVGTPFLYRLSRMLWAMGARNNQETCFSGRLDAENFDRYRAGMAGCYRCPVKCRPLMDITVEKDRSPVSDMIKAAEELGYDGESYLTGDGPEYVTVGKFGANVGIDDPAAVIYLNNICNDLGLDTAGTGGAIAWAMECYQKGLIGDKETGFPLRWGDPVAVARCLFLLGKNKGFGRVLMSGSRAVDEGHYPEEALEFRMCIKGLMQSDPHDARILKAFALGTAVSTRGFDHLRNRPTLEINAGINDNPEIKQLLYKGRVSGDPVSYEGKEFTVKMCEEIYAVGDSVGMCRFSTKLFNSPSLPDYESWAAQIENAYGIKLAEYELARAGKNIRDIERVINYSLGVRKIDDTVPRRWMEEPVKGGQYQGEFIDREEFAKLIGRYYKICKLNSEGIPAADALAALNRIVYGYNIDIFIHPSVYDKLNESHIAMKTPVNSLPDLLGELDKIHPGLSRILRGSGVNVSHNGQLILNNADRLVFSDGDRVEFLTAMSGG